MDQKFMLEVEGDTLVWNVKPLLEKTKTSLPFQWEIPSSFLEEYSWGEDHPSEHIHRILNANLDYPIIIWDGIILDGCHRVCKTLAQGNTFISAIEIINIPPPDDTLSENPHPPSEKWTFKDVVEIVKAIISYRDPNERHPLDP